MQSFNLVRVCVLISSHKLSKSLSNLFIQVAGVPRLNTPPPLSSASLPSSQERLIAAPKPLRITPNLVNRLEDLSQPWTRSPTKSKLEPVLATWHFISPDPLLTDGTGSGMFCLPVVSENFFPQQNLNASELKKCG